MKWTLDTDNMIETLKNDQPLSMGIISDDDTNKDKLVCLFALPELAPRIQAFAEGLLEEHRLDKRTN